MGGCVTWWQVRRFFGSVGWLRNCHLLRTIGKGKVRWAASIQSKEFNWMLLAQVHHLLCSFEEIHLGPQQLEQNNDTKWNHKIIWHNGHLLYLLCTVKISYSDSARTAFFNNLNQLPCNSKIIVVYMYCMYSVLQVLTLLPYACSTYSTVLWSSAISTVQKCFLLTLLNWHSNSALQFDYNKSVGKNC